MEQVFTLAQLSEGSWEYANPVYTCVFGKGLTMFVNICCEKYCCRTGYLGHNFEQSDLCKNAVIVTSALLEYGQKPFKMNHCGVNEQDTAKVGEGLSMKGSR